MGSQKTQERKGEQVSLPGKGNGQKRSRNLLDKII